MSDANAMLACFRYCLGCPRPYLIGVRDAKVASIEGISAGNTFVRDAS